MRTRYLATLALILSISGCAMNEEVKRIEEVKRNQRQREAARSTNLTGQQVFIRTCNTCHPGGDKGMGPSLSDLNTKFPDDGALKKLIRSGKGIMPPQPKSAINDKELDSLIDYLRHLND